MIRVFAPPAFTAVPTDRSYPTWRDWLMGNLQKWTKYVLDWETDLGSSFNTFLTGFGPDIASATAITPSAMIHQVTGMVPIATINAPQNVVGPLFLYCRDGLTLNASGNIRPVLVVAAGHCAILAYHPVLGIWTGTTS